MRLGRIWHWVVTWCKEVWTSFYRVWMCPKEVWWFREKIWMMRLIRLSSMMEESNFSCLSSSSYGTLFPQVGITDPYFQIVSTWSASHWGGLHLHLVKKCMFLIRHFLDRFHIFGKLVCSFLCFFFVQSLNKFG